MWKWKKTGARTLDTNTPIHLTEGDDDDNMDEAHKDHDHSENNAEAKQENEKEQQNADDVEQPPIDGGATPREPPDMTDQPP